MLTLGDDRSGAASGIDLDSDLLIELSEHPNCFGAKVSAVRPSTASSAYLWPHS